MADTAKASSSKELLACEAKQAQFQEHSAKRLPQLVQDLASAADGVGATVKNCRSLPGGKARRKPDFSEIGELLKSGTTGSGALGMAAEFLQANKDALAGLPEDVRGRVEVGDGAVIAEAVEIEPVFDDAPLGEDLLAGHQGLSCTDAGVNLKLKGVKIDPKDITVLSSSDDEGEGEESSEGDETESEEPETSSGKQEVGQGDEPKARDAADAGDAADHRVVEMQLGLGVFDVQGRVPSDLHVPVIERCLVAPASASVTLTTKQ